MTTTYLFPLATRNTAHRLYRAANSPDLHCTYRTFVKFHYSVLGTSRIHSPCKNNLSRRLFVIHLNIVVGVFLEVTPQSRSRTRKEPLHDHQRYDFLLVLHAFWLLCSRSIEAEKRDYVRHLWVVAGILFVIFMESSSAGTNMYL